MFDNSVNDDFDPVVYEQELDSALISQGSSLEGVSGAETFCYIRLIDDNSYLSLKDDWCVRSSTPMKWKVQNHPEGLLIKVGDAKFLNYYLACGTRTGVMGVWRSRDEKDWFVLKDDFMFQVKNGLNKVSKYSERNKYLYARNDYTGLRCRFEIV